ncbi:hypothetical protein J7E70_17230 [Variovorax paradoxus]|nr:hypothetical protein [Variovorax paradoxus]MBT2302205.1 hypothetical protein [Variovorax paradoxus]
MQDGLGREKTSGWTERGAETAGQRFATPGSALIEQFWHERYHDDAASRWLRALLPQAMQQVFAIRGQISPSREPIVPAQ